MKDKKIIKNIIFLSFPIILENIFQTLLGTADTYFAGKLHDNAIAAIGITNLIMNIFIAFYTAISVGASAVISRYVGRKETENVTTAISHSLLLGIILGGGIGIVSLVFCKPILTISGAREEIMSYAIPYYLLVAVLSIFLCISQILSSCLRSVKDTKTPMIVTGFSNIINIILNFLFIKIGFGIIGLALATTISRIAVVIFLFIKLKRKKDKIKIIPKKIEIEKKIIWNIIKIGFPAGGEKLVMRIGQLVYNGMIISLGTSIYVAHNIGGTIESYSYIPAFGFGMALATLVGISLGEEDTSKAKKTTFIAYIITTICMSVIGLFFYIFAPSLVNLFTDTQEVKELVIIVVRLIAFFQPFAALTQIMTSALQGAGDTKFPMYITIIGIWIIRVGVGYLLAVSFQFGLFGVWIGYAMDITIRGVLLFIRFLNGNWKKIIF